MRLEPSSLSSMPATGLQRVPQARAAAAENEAGSKNLNEWTRAQNMQDLIPFGDRIVAFKIEGSTGQQLAQPEPLGRIQNGPHQHYPFISKNTGDANLVITGSDATCFGFLPKEWQSWTALDGSKSIAPRLFRIITEGGGTATALTDTLLAKSNVLIRLATQDEKRKLADQIRNVPENQRGPSISFSNLIPVTRLQDMPREEQARLVLAA